MRSLLFSSIVLACACAPKHPGPSERDLARAAVLYGQALAVQGFEKNLDAVLLLDEALALDPDHAGAHRARMIFAERAGRHDEVIESANWISEHGADALERSDALARITRVALLDGDLDLARGAVARLDELEPDHARTAALWAKYFFERGDLGQAERHARRAAKLQPELPTANQIIALAREADGALEEASAYFRQVLRFDPGHLGARDHLATLLLRMGRAAEADQHRAIHTAIVRATPGGFRFLPPDDRIAAFGSVVVLLPEWQLGHMELARALMQAGLLEEARARMDVALALDPNGPEANELMAALLLRLGDDAGAERHAELSLLPGTDGEPGLDPTRGARE